jgi:hypothetical protein
LTSDKWGVRLETAEDAFFTNFERLRLEAAAKLGNRSGFAIYAQIQWSFNVYLAVKSR